MALAFAGVSNSLFTNSERENEGINSKGIEKVYNNMGTTFIPDLYTDIDQTGDVGTIKSKIDNLAILAPVDLPDGAVITACVVYGNAGATAEIWEMVRAGITSPTSTTIASANIGTESKTFLPVSTVDNENYTYAILASLDTNDIIYSLRITYTI